MMKSFDEIKEHYNGHEERKSSTIDLIDTM